VKHAWENTEDPEKEVDEEISVKPAVSAVAHSLGKVYVPLTKYLERQLYPRSPIS
jgi:hypothetical protein